MPVKPFDTVSKGFTGIQGFRFYATAQVLPQSTDPGPTLALNMINPKLLLCDSLLQENINKNAVEQNENGNRSGAGTEREPRRSRSRAGLEQEPSRYRVRAEREQERAGDRQIPSRSRAGAEQDPSEAGTSQEPSRN